MAFSGHGLEESEVVIVERIDGVSPFEII